MPHTGEQLASWLGIDTDGDELIDALVACCWLDKTPAGLIVHDWADHRPKYIDDRIRIRTSRNASRNVRYSREPSANSSELSPPSDSASGFKKEDNTSPAPAAFGDVCSPGKSRHEYTEAFETWWEHYPKLRRKAKLECFRKYAAAAKHVGHEKLLAAVKAYAASDEGRGQYCPEPARWLAKGRYEDDAVTWQSRNGQAATDAIDRSNETVEQKRRRIWG
jgi:hypothetical protein